MGLHYGKGGSSSSLDWLCGSLTIILQLQGSDAREMVMMSLVHEHNRSMNAHHAAKRARIAAGHTAQQPQFSGGLLSAITINQTSGCPVPISVPGWIPYLFIRFFGPYFAVRC